MLSKPEFRAEAWLIKQANCNKADRLDLKESLGTKVGLVFIKVLFALDELRIEDTKERRVRKTDILGVGIYDNEAYPLLIELKYKKMLHGRC